MLAMDVNENAYIQMPLVIVDHHREHARSYNNNKSQA
jgi:hypothetical protein